eukprot:11159842-Lingulodinium_polyedra.AAC.1
MDVEFLAARCLLKFTSEECRTALPGLGIPPVSQRWPTQSPWVAYPRSGGMGMSVSSAWHSRIRRRRLC